MRPLIRQKETEMDNVMMRMTTITMTMMMMQNKQAVWEAATICPRPLQVDLDLLTLKVVSESL